MDVITQGAINALVGIVQATKTVKSVGVYSPY